MSRTNSLINFLLPSTSGTSGDNLNLPTVTPPPPPRRGSRSAHTHILKHTHTHTSFFHFIKLPPTNKTDGRESESILGIYLSRAYTFCMTALFEKVCPCQVILRLISTHRIFHFLWQFRQKKSLPTKVSYKKWYLYRGAENRSNWHRNTLVNFKTDTADDGFKMFPGNSTNFELIRGSNWVPLCAHIAFVYVHVLHVCI